MKREMIYGMILYIESFHIQKYLLLLSFFLSFFLFYSSLREFIFIIISFSCPYVKKEKKKKIILISTLIDILNAIQVVKSK